MAGTEQTGTEPTELGETVPHRVEPAERPPWRSEHAAALLNLTGLGLGYLYLGHQRRTAATCAVTLVLVVAAFKADAAGNPWLWRWLAAAALVAAAGDAWRLARTGGRGPAPDRAGRTRPVAVALAAVVAVVAAYLGYGAVGRTVFADARTAQAQGDCSTAVRGFDTVTGPFELTLSRDVSAAAALRAECRAFLEAQQAEQQRRYEDAVTRYRVFRSAHPASVLVPFATDDLRRAYRDWATALRSDRQYDRAISVYRDLLAEVGRGPEASSVRAGLAATYGDRAAATRTRIAGTAPSVAAPPVDVVAAAFADLLQIEDEFPETPTAATVPRALADTYAASTRALGEGRPCDALPVLRYVAGLPAGAGDVVGTANADRARALLDCGLGAFRAGRPGDAVDPLTELTTAYPNDPGTAQARSAIIAARVAEDTGESVPLPAPLGDDSPGAIPTVFYNDSPYEITVRVAGPTAHEFVLPACDDCPVYGPAEEPSCAWGSSHPSHALSLQPGQYVDAVDGPAGTTFSDTDSGARTLQPGYRYWTCYWVWNALGLTTT